MTVKHISTANIVNKTTLPATDYSVNPYVGCTHGCIYCYADFMAGFTGHKGEKWCSFLDVKEDYIFPSPEKLRDKVILVGSATDPYNHYEKQLGNTRLILEKLRDFPLHIDLLTKSPLVLQDLELLRTMTNINVGFSIAASDDFARVMEPHAPPPSARIEALRTLHEAGVPTFVFISPIFPFFTDYKSIVAQVKDYVDYVSFENLTLRGTFRNAVCETIRNNFSEKLFYRFISIYESPIAFKKFWTLQEQEIIGYMESIKVPYKMYFFHSAK